MAIHPVEGQIKIMLVDDDSETSMIENTVAEKLKSKRPKDVFDIKPHSSNDSLPTMSDEFKQKTEENKAPSLLDKNVGAA